MKSIILACLLLMPVRSFAQAVDVTVSLDQATLAAGQSTVLRVKAQIKPALTGVSKQIFSWYIDVQNSNGSAGQADYDSLVMNASDNTPGLSSGGTTAGAHRRGIRNTFLNQPGAGKQAPIELLAIPVTAGQPGTAVFTVQAGTTVTNLAYDFIVATTNQVDPYTGGDYSAASATLTVTAAGTIGPPLSIARVTQGIEISFTPIAGADHAVQFRADLAGGPDWADLPNAPHNTGTLIDTESHPSRSYRLLVSPL